MKTVPFERGTRIGKAPAKSKASSRNARSHGRPSRRAAPFDQWEALMVNRAAGKLKPALFVKPRHFGTHPGRAAEPKGLRIIAQRACTCNSASSRQARRWLPLANTVGARDPQLHWIGRALDRAGDDAGWQPGSAKDSGQARAAAQVTDQPAQPSPHDAFSARALLAIESPGRRQSAEPSGGTRDDAGPRPPGALACGSGATRLRLLLRPKTGRAVEKRSPPARPETRRDGDQQGLRASC